MSSLKDIMNIEEEPLQPRNLLTSQHQEVNSRSFPQPPQPDTRFTDSRYSAQLPRLPPIEALPTATSISNRLSSPSAITRKRSRQSPKTPTVSAFGLASGSSPSTGPDLNLVYPNSSARRRTSLGTEYMDSRYSQERSISPSAGYSSSNSNMGRSELRRGIDLAEIGEKRTPVTGRISKAKKGLPVHDCPICGDSRKPFSRAEHLRRHMQTHQPPSFHCTVHGCDKSFHRKDLLERHLERHNEGQSTNQMQDSGRGSRSVSTGYMKIEPPHTPPQQSFNAESMNMDVPASSFTMDNASPQVSVSPMNGRMNMMEQYSPISPHIYRGRNASVSFNQSFEHVHYQPSEQQLASPISLPIDAPAHYAQVLPITTCAETSPMVTYVTSSSLPACSMNLMNTSSFPASNGFQHPYTSVPMSYPENTQAFSPQLHANQIAERLLNVQIPHSTSAMNRPHSPLYHSDNSNSTFSTPSDIGKSHNWPPNTPRDRAWSAPGSYPTPMLNVESQFYQHPQMNRRSQRRAGAIELGFEQNFAVCDDDNDCVSTTATFNGTDTGSEAEANDNKYSTEIHQQLLQEQFEAQGGGPVQTAFMEDYYEQQNGQSNCY